VYGSMRMEIEWVCCEEGGLWKCDDGSPLKVSLLWRSGGAFCGQMIPRTMLAVANATGRAAHARQVKGDDPD
jgi:hypothetical protein